MLAAWAHDARFRAGWRPDPDLFAMPAHRAMADAMARLGAEADADGLVIELKRNDQLRLFDGGADGVTDLLYGTPSVNDPWPQVDLLRQLKALKALRRGLLEAVQHAETTCDLSSARALVSEAVAASHAAAPATAVAINQAFSDAFRKASNPELRERGIHVGKGQLDNATGGIRKGNVWVIGAESNWGKTALLVNIADRAVCAGIKPLIVYGEDPEDLYAQRWMARRSRVKLWKMRDHSLEDEDMQRLTNVIADVPDWPCFLNGIDRPCEALASAIRSLVASDGIGLVLVDYIQAFRTDAKVDNQRLRIANIARTFTSAIKVSGAAGVLFSQVTKDDKGVHLRDSEDVFMGAEVVLYGENEVEKQVGASGDESSVIERKFLRLAKVKDGPRHFRVELDWEPQYAAFQMDDRLYRTEPDYNN